MSEIRLQEIIARAVVGRGEHQVVWSHAARAEGVEGVLGVHVNNASVTVNGVGEDGAAVLQLRATCDLWCACGDETRVQRLICTWTESAPVELRARVIGETEIEASLLNGVRCIEAGVRDGQLHLVLETQVALEVMGLARFWIRTYDLMDAAGEADESGLSLAESGSGSSGSDYSGAHEFDGEAGDDLDGVVALRGSSDLAGVPKSAATRERDLRCRDDATARREQNRGRFQIVQGL